MRAPATEAVLDGSSPTRETADAAVAALCRLSSAPSTTFVRPPTTGASWPAASCIGSSATSAAGEGGVGAGRRNGHASSSPTSMARPACSSTSGTSYATLLADHHRIVDAAVEPPRRHACRRGRRRALRLLLDGSRCAAGSLDAQRALARARVAGGRRGRGPHGPPHRRADELADRLRRHRRPPRRTHLRRRSRWPDPGLGRGPQRCSAPRFRRT